MKLQNLYYEEGLDEIAMLHNPRGGKPMEIGSRTWLKDRDIQIEEVKEFSRYMYHLGYCTCGRRIVIGDKRAQLIVNALAKKGIVHRRQSRPLRAMLAKAIYNPQTGENRY
ncbi:MAG: hypothetical protein ACOYUZ_00460 [Patescibacteria group bacterium]